MNNLDRLRELLPFAMALMLASSVAQLQAKRPLPSHMPRISVHDVVAGIKWHMVEMAKNEQTAQFGGLSGD